MKHIPKRRLIPIITDLLEYGEAANHTIDYAKRMQQKYGDVCEVSFTGIKNYFIHDPEVIKEILTTKGPKMKRTYLFKAFRKFLGNGLFTNEGESHKQQRKLIKPTFYPKRIEEYSTIMVICANEEISKWKDGDTININQAMTRITLKVITKTMFSSGLEDKTIDEVGSLLQVAFDLMNKIITNPFYSFCLIREIKIPIVVKFYKLKAELDEVVNRIIATYRKDSHTKKLDLLSMLMEAKDKETGSGMTDEQIRDEVMTFFLAGHETTTLALTWSLYLIAKHPEIEKQFQQEVQTKIVGPLPQASDYASLHFTKNIFKETLRLYPPAWTFARAPMEDMEILGYHFPKNCVLWTVTYLLHHDERYFHDAELFLPSRWDEDASQDIPKYAYIPFGGGNRMCIGEGFAWMEGILVLATIASKFNLELPTDFTTEINPVFTLRTKQNVMMKVTKHLQNN